MIYFLNYTLNQKELFVIANKLTAYLLTNTNYVPVICLQRKTYLPFNHIIYLCTFLMQNLSALQIDMCVYYLYIKNKFHFY